MRNCWPTVSVRLVAGVFVSFFLGAQAAVRLPAVISDGMVMQSGASTTLWGWADPSEQVTVTLAGQETSTRAGADGKWQVRLPTPRERGPHTLVIRGQNTLEVKDVLIGELWLASGQSNMAFRTRGVQNSDEEIATANYPDIRVFMAEETFAQAPASDLKGRWVRCTPENAPDFPAVAYFYARELHRALKQPVGIVASTVGGTRIQTWMSAELLNQDPRTRAELEQWKSVSAEEFQKIAVTYRAFQHARSVHAIAAAETKKKGQTPPPAPVQPKKRCHDCPSALWNGMVAPIAGYTIRGFIWYQGESNTGRPAQYDTLFPAMMRQWRIAWGDDQLPFYYVQLANYSSPGPKGNYARLRESQRRALNVPYTGMAVTIDIGNANDIHSRNKQEVGRRLSLWALNRTYGQSSLVCSGPLFRKLEVRNGAAFVEFDYAGDGLVAKGGRSPSLFEIAGSDGRFVPAKAEIVGPKVRVWSDAVAAPLSVRYAWADNPEGCNLYNGAGLPASSFTTENN